MIITIAITLFLQNPCQNVSPFFQAAEQILVEISPSAVQKKELLAANHRTTETLKLFLSKLELNRQKLFDAFLEFGDDAHFSDKEMALLEDQFKTNLEEIHKMEEMFHRSMLNLETILKPHQVQKLDGFTPNLYIDQEPLTALKKVLVSCQNAIKDLNQEGGFHAGQIKEIKRELEDANRIMTLPFFFQYRLSVFLDDYTTYQVSFERSNNAMKNAWNTLSPQGRPFNSKILSFIEKTIQITEKNAKMEPSNTARFNRVILFSLFGECALDLYEPN